MAQTKSLLTVEDIKGDLLYGVLLKARDEAADYPDTEILRKIRAAEDFYESNVNIALGIRKYVSGAHVRGITLDPDAAIPEEEEAGYDYDPDWNLGQKFGGFKLRNRPIIPADTDSGIVNFFFAFPSAETKLYNVPQGWISPDFKNGQLNIIPSSGAIIASFGTWFLGVAASGAIGIPKIVYVDYLAGYDASRLRRDHADLLEGLKLRTLLLLGGILGNITSPGIGNTSIGLDGLSHSRGFAGGKYGRFSGQLQLAIEQEKEIRDSFRNHAKGIVFTTV